MKEFENPFAPDNVKKAVSIIHLINHMDIGGIDADDLLTAIEALDRQMPMTAVVTHKQGEEAAIIECNCCGQKIIANYDLYREHRKEWYCKVCGQRCVLPNESMQAGEAKLLNERKNY